MSSLSISRLYRYPVKSFPGIAVERLALDDFGPAGDRRWLVVDADGQFVTQRAEPRLALIDIVSETPFITLGLPGGKSLELAPGAEPIKVGVWRDQVEGVRAAGTASATLSAWLGRELYFVYMPSDSFRPVDPDFVGGTRRVGFADGFPFLLTNEASLAAVDQWTGKPWNMRRFRPGIVVNGAEAFAEDGWHWLRIGEAILECVKPCSRCIMTTVDPEHGTLDPDREPLRTLSRHRRTHAGVIFGQNAVHWHGTAIAVGDAVELLSDSPL
jgi:uncharacterized protein YcbX